jgi:transcriptional regulator with GAF, ATPase, and Fis domain
MSLTSHQKTHFDIRLLEIEQLFRQRKPEIAKEQLRSLIDSGYAPEGYELGLFNSLLAEDFHQDGKYLEAIKLGLEAKRILASSAFHQRIGNLYYLLYKSYSSLGDLKAAERYIYDALAFYRQANDSVGMVGALNGLAKLAFIRCDFSKAIEFVSEAIENSKGDNIRMAEEIGNLGRIELLNGDWESAEDHLKTALKLAEELGLQLSLARNHLSLGFLHLRKRQFGAASHQFTSASRLIDQGNFRRERIILFEYEGELAYESGDLVRAKKSLAKAYNLGRELAPESDLVSQTARRLAQAELALDNYEEALKLAQKALDLANRLGEKAEMGLCHVVIAEIFCARDDLNNSAEYASNGIEILREAGDPYDLARSLVATADVLVKSRSVSSARMDKVFDEAYNLFNKLKVFYWSAETRLRHGRYCCDHFRISSGFRYLIESEKIFEKISEKAKVRSIQMHKKELSQAAIDLSLSQENEFKIFGNYFSDSEYSNLKSGHLEEIIGILEKRTSASRVVIYKKRQNDHDAIANASLNQHQKRRFIQNFNDLLGEEFNPSKPTYILDSRRDPFINELLYNENDSAVSSVIVVPLILGKEVAGYLYIDRLGSNGDFQPFGQRELNFAVGFADLIALKMAEYDKLLLEEDNRRLKAQLMEQAAFPNIITQNRQMLEMLARVQQVVNSNISMALEGETGSGKDLLAKAIHYGSNRKEKKFISVNCAALPETLLESELFGHKRGAFTGADRDKVGLFEEADGGTFFLDEIADMPPAIQAKVLRILEEKEVVRLGETKPQKVDVRIISATNRDLKAEMEAGRFRQDLYYRLTALCFKIPPLRERREDIPLLINHFAGDKVRFTPDALRKLVAFDWPGNVRELENEVKKLVLLAGDKAVIDADLLSGKITEAAGASNSGHLELNMQVDFNDHFSLYDYLAEYEKRFIIKALKEHGGVKKHAAASLNIPESTLRLKIKQYDIDVLDLDAVA